MATKKINAHAADSKAIEARREELTAQLESLRAQYKEAEGAFEQAEEKSEELDARLRGGDLSVSTEDLLSAQVDVRRWETVRDGLRARISTTERTLERTSNPKLALLVARFLNEDALLGGFEWFAVESREKGHALRRELPEGSRVGIVREDSPALVGTSASLWTGRIILDVSHDPLTRQIRGSEIESALQRSNRIVLGKFDPVVGGSETTQQHRFEIASAHVDEMPVIDLGRIGAYGHKYEGPYRLPQFGCRVSTQEVSTGTPELVDAESRVYEIEGTCTYFAFQNEAGYGNANSHVHAANIVGQADGHPVYGPLGKTVTSEAEILPGGGLKVRQVFRFAAA